MKILFAVKLDHEDWQEQLITEIEADIELASKWAIKNGFNRLRIAEISNEFPNFSKTVNL